MSTEDAVAQSLMYQLLDPANRPDPYPLYARCRAHGPIKLPDSPFTIFTSYRDCEEVLRHPSSSSDPLNSILGPQGLAAQPWQQSGRRLPIFLWLDPPDHTRLRKLFSKAFVPRVINELQSDIAALVDGVLDGIAERGRFDAVVDLGHPLPVAVICRLLGVPVGDEPQFDHVSAVLANAMDPLVTMSDEQVRAARWLQEYLYGLIEQRRAHPGDDFLSRLIAVEEAGDQLTEEEMVSTIALLLVSGHETTVNLIANAILAMLRHPRQWAALGADTGRAGAVIEETLRYDAPVQTVGRHATKDMTIGNTTMVKGDTMVLVLAAANRDPTDFERPDVFDPDRKAFRHLAFGRGPHFCVGASLARLEAGIVLPAVAARFTKARLAADPQYKSNILLRGLSTLSVAV